MVVACYSYNGKLPFCQVEKNAKIISAYYQKNIFQPLYHTDILALYGPEASCASIHQDKASSHTARSTVAYMTLSERDPAIPIPTSWFGFINGFAIIQRRIESGIDSIQFCFLLRHVPSHKVQDLHIFYMKHVYLYLVYITKKSPELSSAELWSQISSGSVCILNLQI